jgi:hypothetical protein
MEGGFGLDWVREMADWRVFMSERRVLSFEGFKFEAMRHAMGDGNLLAGIIPPGKGALLARGSSRSPANALKSPDRSAAVGT